MRYLHLLTVLFTVPFFSVTSAQGIKDTTIHLSPVEIHDSIVKDKPFLIKTIRNEEIQKGAVRDIGDYLRSIPNVSGVRKGGAGIDPVVRGFKFSQLSVNVGGGLKVENGCPNRMDPVTSHVEAEDIESIEVLKGPFALKYGPSFGGIINLRTENPHPFEKFEVHANAMYGFETNWNGQKEHLSVLGRNYGNYTSGKIEGKDTTFNTSFRKHNYTAKIGFSPTKNQSIIVSYDEIHGRDVLYPALPMDEKSDDTRMMSVDYHLRHMPGKLKTLDIKIYQSDVNHNMDNSLRATWATKQMVSIVNAVNTGGRAEFGMQFSKFLITTGLDVENIYKDGTRTMTMQMMGTTSTKRSNLWKAANIQNAGFFGECKTTFSSIELLGAIRVDFNNADSKDTLKVISGGISYFDKTNSKFTNFSASAGITKKFSKKMKLSLALGRGTRSPNMLERFIKLMAVGYDNYDYLGNPQLKPETNYEADLTLTYSGSKTGSAYINGFYSNVHDYIYSTMLPSTLIKPQTAGVLGVKQFVNVDYVTFMGFEFGYTSPADLKFGGSTIGSFTYGRIPEVTKYLITGTQVTGETIIKDDALSEIPPFESTLNVFYKMVKGKLVPQLSIRAVADQHHVSQAFYEQDTPGFGLINFTVKYTVNKNMKVTAGINNILDKAYYEHLNRKIIGSTGNLYEPGRSFFVNLFLNI
ncbi:MAG: TonB-dependent receptor [Bacteroidetes bacterium]|nr:TonB-dependent receptor [Bacteroidota bacterium]